MDFYWCSDECVWIFKWGFIDCRRVVCGFKRCVLMVGWVCVGIQVGLY